MKKIFFLILVSLLAFTSCKKDSNPTSPTEEAATVTYAGKVYHTVKIGTQTWLKENLDVGVMIDSMQNPSNNGTIEKYCYRNDTVNCTKYGGLYQWDEAMAYDTIERAKGICPTGWHIPTKAEFEILAAAVNNNGNTLKAVGQGTGNGAGTDSSGFSALYAGYRSNYGYFYFLLSNPFFWSSMESNTLNAYDMHMDFDDINIYYYSSSFKEYGLSIRCIKD